MTCNGLHPLSGAAVKAKSAVGYTMIGALAVSAQPAGEVATSVTLKVCRNRVVFT